MCQLPVSTGPCLFGGRIHLGDCVMNLEGHGWVHTACHHFHMETEAARPATFPGVRRRSPCFYCGVEQPTHMGRDCPLHPDRIRAAEMAKAKATAKAAAKAQAAAQGAADVRDETPFSPAWVVYEESYAAVGVYLTEASLRAALRPGGVFPPGPAQGLQCENQGQATLAYYRAFPLRRHVDSWR
jgi:hypothetical protein